MKWNREVQWVGHFIPYSFSGYDPRGLLLSLHPFIARKTNRQKESKAE